MPYLSEPIEDHPGDKGRLAHLGIADQDYVAAAAAVVVVVVVLVLFRAGATQQAHNLWRLRMLRLRLVT